MTFVRPTQEQYAAMLADWRADKAGRDEADARLAAAVAATGSTFHGCYVHSGYTGDQCGRSPYQCEPFPAVDAFPDFRDFTL